MTWDRKLRGMADNLHHDAVRKAVAGGGAGGGTVCLEAKRQFLPDVNLGGARQAGPAPEHGNCKSLHSLRQDRLVELVTLCVKRGGGGGLSEAALDRRVFGVVLDARDHVNEHYSCQLERAGLVCHARNFLDGRRE
eukprot:764776-Hanusia_phi.AAC.2